MGHGCRAGVASLRSAGDPTTRRGRRPGQEPAGTRGPALADGLAGSPQETRLRLLLHRSGLPCPAAQHAVRDAGGLVARVDFAWPERTIALEYEGAWHGDSPQQVAADRRRRNPLSAAGWTVVFVTAADLHRPWALLHRLAAALAVGCVGLSSPRTS